MQSIGRYCQEHWVSPECGYYAIAGKLAPEEEAQLLQDVVAALEPEPEPLSAWRVRARGGDL